ncbi:hypothetical protein H072_9316 [Dactylellina haptotyla CBS 200.50]|uniref:Uncharacterized protein n=1 Tax=Dactylellina haptotyla (strain CBS 200.50) TaxID=1284197 RepID=S8A7E8_DACHA|nr:hypothetical protein H072_9316 [Dactylellina haptotyla CBS 200.50]
MPPKKSRSSTLKSRPGRSKVTKPKSSKSPISSSPATTPAKRASIKPPPAMSTRSKSKSSTTGPARSTPKSPRRAAAATPRQRSKHIAEIIEAPDTAQSSMGNNNGVGFMGFGFVRSLFSGWGYGFGSTGANKKTTARGGQKKGVKKRSSK